MNDLIKNIILVIFPILIYLVLCCCNLINNKKKKEWAFILMLVSSLYLEITFNGQGKIWILFVNIPILISYLNRKWYLGMVLSIIVIVVASNRDINIYFLSGKFIIYLILYFICRKNITSNDNYLIISQMIQAFFMAFEYYLSMVKEIRVYNLFFFIIIAYLITFGCLYLLNLANKIISMNLVFSEVEKDKKIKEALFKLTHEIKNPLAVCMGYISMMNLHDYDKSIKYMEIIKNELGRSLDIMSDFVEFNKIKINKDIIDVTLLMEEVYNSFKILGMDKKIKFKYDSNLDEVLVNGDFERLKQVMVNVIKNSIEAISDNGNIELKIRIKSGMVLLKIIDDGMGMDRDELAKMKEMFYTTKENGTGLGVALSNEIIEAHNGKMDYISKKGMGTTCIISLPML